MVVANAKSSKMFWRLNSWLEKVPRFSSSTSFTVSVRRLDGISSVTNLLHYRLRAKIFSSDGHRSATISISIVVSCSLAFLTIAPQTDPTHDHSRHQSSHGSYWAEIGPQDQNCCH